VTLGAGVNISNVGFHAPPKHPAWANDGTFNSQGYSNTPWTVTQAGGSITWNTETFAQNQNANAIRWGTMYNFRFDADQPPQNANATVEFFKTGSPMAVAIQAPAGGATPTPTATVTPTATPTPTLTPAGCSVSSQLCGGVFSAPLTAFAVDLTEPVDPATLDASDFTVNGIPADNVTLVNGDMTIDFTFNTSPAVEGVNTMHIATGAFNCFNGPVLEFNCGFRYIPSRPRPTPAPRP